MPYVNLTGANDSLRRIMHNHANAVVHEDALDAFDYIASAMEWAIYYSDPSSYREPGEKVDFDHAYRAIRTITTLDAEIEEFLRACGIERTQP